MNADHRIRKSNLNNFKSFSTRLHFSPAMFAWISRAKVAIFAEFRDLLAAEEHLLRLTLNEAEALAWQTPVPHLVFPVLAREKAQAVAAWYQRQQSILRRGRGPVLALAA